MSLSAILDFFAILLHWDASSCFGMQESNNYCVNGPCVQGIWPNKGLMLLSRELTTFWITAILSS